MLAIISVSQLKSRSNGKIIAGDSVLWFIKRKKVKMKVYDEP